MKRIMLLVRVLINPNDISEVLLKKEKIRRQQSRDIKRN